jgi:glutaredoxin-like protein
MTVLLDEQIQAQVKEAFAELDQPVHILFFATKEQCQFCSETLQLVEEVSALSGIVTLHRFDIDADTAIARNYHVEQTPTLVIAGENEDGLVDYGIRFLGIPSGYEFSSLIQDILIVSSRNAGLNDQTLDFLAGLTEPVLLQVFVTPTCPYCPQAVVTAHRLALESPLVEAEMVEATEFPELSNRYQIMSVPDTVINHGAGRVIGAVPEGRLAIEIKTILAKTK